MAYQRPRLDRDTAQAQAAGAPSLQAGTLDVHPHRQACRGPGRDRLARTAPQRQPDRLAHPRPRQQDPQDRPRRRLQRLTRPDPAEPCSERRPALSVSTSENDQNPAPHPACQNGHNTAQRLAGGASEKNVSSAIAIEKLSSIRRDRLSFVRPARTPGCWHNGEDAALASILIHTWTLATGRVLRSEVPPDELSQDELIAFWADDHIRDQGQEPLLAPSAQERAGGEQRGRHPAAPAC